MAENAVLKVVQKYLSTVSQMGLPVKAGVLFGSFANGRPHEWSDIDLIVVSPRFDGKVNRRDIDLLWHVAAQVDSRIEPIGVGERQYQEDRSSYIIEIARHEGQIIPLAE